MSEGGLLVADMDGPGDKLFRHRWSGGTINFIPNINGLGGPSEA